ncbi:MAG: 50S ribosomal protein L9 [Rhodobiaceae bacterium UBA7378]|nr:MAG: 50S ribosomal protein L9 [Rhodobiaceae bacterium UBA7378]
MQIVLLERISKLGQMGDVVNVKDGYARNFLLPQGKALRANKANLERFESERAQLEARNLDRKNDAEAVNTKLNDKTFVIIRQSGDTGQLYGSVTTRDIASQLSDEGFSVEKNQITLEIPIKNLGLHKVSVMLHPEVTSTVIVNVARTEEEAERQAAGEDVTSEHQADAEEINPDVEEIFEEGVEVELSEAEAEVEATTEAVEDVVAADDSAPDATEALQAETAEAQPEDEDGDETPA